VRGALVPDATFLTPADVAAKVNARKVDLVLGWIHSGQLKATNIGSNPTGRPTWRIDPADLEKFLESRRATLAAKVEKRSRRPKRERVTAYF
jgi:hypothetical protein